MTSTSAVIGIVVVFLACAAARQAARRKGRSPAWGFGAFVFPPLLLLLELLSTSNPPPAPVASNLVLEWVASLVVLAFTLILIVQIANA